MSKERHERFALGIKKGKNCQMSKEQRERFALGLGIKREKTVKNCQKHTKSRIFLVKNCSFFVTIPSNYERITNIALF